MAETEDSVSRPARPSREAVVWQARCLLRAARAGTLATAKDGQPYAALVTPAPAPDLSLLMLLSGLSVHTSHLQDDGRCALMVMGAPTDANPQTAPRLTVLGIATPEDDPALKARWIARHPYAAFYADLPDFRLVRLRPSSGQFIGGFASAHRLAEADLTPDAGAVAAVAAAELAILAHMNADHADILARIAGGPGWRIVAVDVDGCDLTQGAGQGASEGASEGTGEGDQVLRVPWSEPVASADAVRDEFVRLGRQTGQSWR